MNFYESLGQFIVIAVLFIITVLVLQLVIWPLVLMIIKENVEFYEGEWPGGFVFGFLICFVTLIIILSMIEVILENI